VKHRKKVGEFKCKNNALFGMPYPIIVLKSDGLFVKVDCDVE
jgi:hypothetical protein